MATFILGAPRFGEVVVALGGGGGTLRIVAHNASATHTTIVKAAVNGVAIDVVNHPFVRFGELVLGEEAVLEVTFILKVGTCGSSHCFWRP